MSDDEGTATNDLSSGTGQLTAAAMKEHYQPLNIGSFDVVHAEDWLDRAELIFECRNITNERRKAVLVMETFTHDTWGIMKSWIRANKPVQYSALREQLMSQYRRSTASRAKEFFETYQTSIGDRQVSHLYNQLQDLLTVPKTATRPEKELDVVMELTISTLPSQVRAALPDYLTLQKVEFFQIAEQLLDNHRNHQERLAAVREMSTVPDEGEKENDLVAPLRPTSRGREGHTPSPVPRQQRRKEGQQQASQQRTLRRPDICYFHRRFGEKAWSCERPCSWQQKNGK